MATNFLHAAGTNGFIATPASVMSTELNSLANGSIAISSVTGTNGVFSQTNFGQAQRCQVWLTVGSTFGAAPAAGGNITGWFLNSTNGGTTFETSIVSGVPRPPDFIIPVSSTVTAYTANSVIYATGFPWMPYGSVKVIVQNNAGASATLPASGNTITVAPIAEQY